MDFLWFDMNYEDVWPIQDLIKTLLENRKTVIRKHEGWKSKGS